MALTCPDCGRDIGGSDIDVAADVAVCRACGKSMSLLALAGVGSNPVAKRLLEVLATPKLDEEPEQLPPVDPANPPRGAWFRDDGMTMEVGASTRSIGLGVFMLLMAAFWCSVTGVFVAMGVVGTLHGLGLVSKSGGAPSLAMSLFLLAFSTPFVAAGVFLVWMALMAFGGRNAVTLRGDDLAVFAGIGPLGRTRRLAASSIESIKEDVRVTTGENGTTTTRSILIACPSAKDVRIGKQLSDHRRRFVLGVLKQTIGR